MSILQGFTRVQYPAAALLLFSLASCTVYQGEPPPGDPPALSDAAVNCISVTRIDNSEILSERTLVFEMTNGEIYRNSLPQRCAGLRDYDAFMYRIPSTQLCRTDLITVLQRTGFGGGPGFMPTSSCPLGAFEPISARELETLRAVE